MSKLAAAKFPEFSVRRRTLLKLLPAAVAASAIPKVPSAAVAGAVGASEITNALLRLWDTPLGQPSAAVRQSSIEAINGMVAGRHAAFVSLLRGRSTDPDTPHPNFIFQSRRFGRINVEVTFRQHTGFLRSPRFVERCYLLLGTDRFDSGNMLGFLRQYGPVYGQRFVIYKPYNDWAGYLIGTTDGIVPKKKQSICIGDFKAESFPAFFGFLRGGASSIEVVKIRFPYRRPYIRDELEF